MNDAVLYPSNLRISWCFPRMILFSLKDMNLCFMIVWCDWEWHMRRLMQMAWSESVSSPHLHSVKHKIIKKCKSWYNLTLCTPAIRPSAPLVNICSVEKSLGIRILYLPPQSRTNVLFRTALNVYLALNMWCLIHIFRMNMYLSPRHIDNR